MLWATCKGQRNEREPVFDDARGDVIGPCDNPFSTHLGTSLSPPLALTIIQGSVIMDHQFSSDMNGGVRADQPAVGWLHGSHRKNYTN